MTQTVAVVVPCRNEARTIAGLLDAVRAQTRPPSEIVVVDDGSTDDTLAVVSQWRQRHGTTPLLVVPGPQRGVAAAFNAGVAACQSEVVVRLDGHSLPAHDYVERSLQQLGQPNVGVAGGRWDIAPGAPGLLAAAIARAVSHPLGSGGVAYRSLGADDVAPRWVDTVPFGSFTRRLWQQMGGLDEALRANEDYDFNYRVRLTGLGVMLDPGIVSVYFARPTLNQLWRQYARYGFWKMEMLRRHPQALQPRQVPPALVAPWLVSTVLLAAVAPSGLSFGLLALYPTAVGLGAADVARRSPEGLALWPAAVAALVTVHLAWSVGFLRGACGLSEP